MNEVKTLSAKRATTKVELGDNYGASYKTACGWCRRPGWPGGQDGPWSYSRTDKELESIGSPYAPSRRNGRNGRVQGQPGENPSTDARRRKLEADARISEENATRLRRENEIESGKLHHIDDLDRNVAEIVLWIKSGADGLPETLARLFPSESKVQVIDEVAAEVRRWLRYMAGWEYIEGKSGDDAILAAADVIRKRRAAEETTNAK